ncbi:MAG TPA: VWA domain-containing protein [Terracidiphilus sp.]|nr:VWA domain-containing protein [Terracidiphilus sp.]
MQLRRGSLLVLALPAIAVIAGQSVASQQDQPTYTLKLPVDEVSLTLQALDYDGQAVDDLKIEDLKVLDNGVRARRIVALDSFKDAPVHVGIMIDSSESMGSSRERSQRAAIAVARSLIRQPADRGFAMDFAVLSPIAKEWTSDVKELEAAIRNHRVASDAGGSLRGTALFDALYRACLNEFGHDESPMSRNVIVMFSDGVDNASRGDLKLAVDECQKTNTAIYAFRFDVPEAASTGPAALAEVATKTGGRVFHGDDGDTQIADDVRMIETDLGARYRLIFKPPEVRHDGAFHRVEIDAPSRPVTIRLQTGYYAPVR